MQKYTELKKRLIADGDEADFGSTGAAPADLYEILAESNESAENPNMLVEVKCRWLDVANAYVAGRGSFNLQLVRVVKVSNTDTVEDTVIASGVANRPMPLDGFRVGDKVGVRLTGMVGPGGGATKLQVLVRVGKA